MCCKKKISKEDQGVKESRGGDENGHEGDQVIGWNTVASRSPKAEQMRNFRMCDREEGERSCSNITGNKD